MLFRQGGRPQCGPTLGEKPGARLGNVLDGPESK